MSTILIRNGHLVDPANKIDERRDVLLRDGAVAEIAKANSIKIRRGDAELIDARGLIVAPGFIDIHVHLREPGQAHKETIHTGTQAALAGGFTTVATMPNTIPVNDSPEITRWITHRDRGAVIDVLPVAAATIGSLGERVSDYSALKSAGAVAVSDDGRPILGDEVMAAVLKAARAAGLPVIQHAEDTKISNGCAINAGPTAFRLGLRGAPGEAEARIVERDLRLLQNIGGHLHIAHVSTRRALDAIRRAKRQGLRLTCEVTPHHFTLLDEHIGDYNTNFKMCPPLRGPDDRDAMLAGLADGTIDCIASDHAPHGADEKQQEFERAPNGITGLETATALALQVLLQHRRLPLRRIVELLSTNPARVLNLRDRGHLSKGARGDVTIFDVNKKWTFTAQDSKSKSKNTPFDGWGFRGRVIRTLTAKDAR